MIFLNKITGYLRNNTFVFFYAVLILNLAILGLGFFVANQFLKMNARIYLLEQYTDSVAKGNIPVLTTDGLRYFSLVELNKILLTLEKNVSKLAAGETVEAEPNPFQLLSQ